MTPVKRKQATLLKMERFAQEYLVDLNASAAYRRAIRPDASAFVAGTEGHLLLKSPEVQEFITKRQAELVEKTKITQERVLEELARIAFLDPRDLMAWGPNGVRFHPSDAISPDAARAVGGVKAKHRTETDKDGNISTTVEMELKLIDKKGALDSLGRHLGLFKDSEPPSLNLNVGVLMVPASPDPAAWAHAAAAQQSRMLGQGSGEAP